jgi:hypothetical protein
MRFNAKTKIMKCYIHLYDKERVTVLELSLLELPWKLLLLLIVFLMTGKLVPFPARAMQLTEYNFLIICRNWNLEKKLEDNFIATRKFN